MQGVTIYYVACNGIEGREVKIVQPNHYLQLAEVQVYGGTGGIKGMGLLSYRKPTKQGSVSHGGHPSRAVDGNANGWWRSRTSIHTNGKVSFLYQQCLLIISRCSPLY